MPTYSQTHFTEFMNRVRAANPHYERIKDSSLHNLVQMLQTNTSAANISGEISRIPADKQLKYQAALTYLRATFPGLGGGAASNAPALQMLSTAAAPALQNVGRAQQARPAPPVPPRHVTRVATPLPTAGYFLIEDPGPVTPTVDVQPPLTRSQVQRLNEAVARCKQAADLAVEAIGGLSLQPSNPLTPEQARYVRWFGALDANRRRQVLQNFMSICIVLGGQRGGRQGTLNIIDARNDAQKFTWFAATIRNSVQNHSVRMWIGRAFFSGGSYEVSSDATVVTMIHELAHACFGASDVPTVGSGLQLGADGMPPSGAPVCNDATQDEQLAAADPESAIINADNYGQYAWSILKDHRG